MTEQDVISKYDYIYGSSFLWLTVIIFISILISILIGTMLYSMIKNHKGFTEALDNVVISVISIIMFISTISVSVPIVDTLVYGDAKKDWEENYAVKYIEGGEKEQKKILKIDAKTVEPLSNDYYKYTKPTEDYPIYTVTYIDNKSVIKKGLQVSVKMDLKKGEYPYIEYKNVKKDLGSIYTKGKYNPEIHLPKGYKFK